MSVSNAIQWLPAKGTSLTSLLVVVCVILIPSHCQALPYTNLNTSGRGTHRVRPRQTRSPTPSKNHDTLNILRGGASDVEDYDDDEIEKTQMRNGVIQHDLTINTTGIRDEDEETDETSDEDTDIDTDSDSDSDANIETTTDSDADAVDTDADTDADEGSNEEVENHNQNEFNNEEDSDEQDPYQDQNSHHSESVLKSSSTLWGSVSSAFQMNIDAKDELIHHEQQHIFSEESRTDKTHGRRDVDFSVSEDLDLDDDNDEDYDADDNDEDMLDNIQEGDDQIEPQQYKHDGVSSNRQIAGVSTASSRLVQDNDDDNYNEAVKKVEVFSVDDSEEEERDKDEPRFKSGDDVSMYTNIDSSSSDSEIIPNEVSLQDQLGNAGNSEDEDTESDEGEHSSSSSAEELNDFSAPMPPTMEDIVREEWSMIPETEVEDEGKENELHLEAINYDRKKQKNNVNEEKKKAENATKEKKKKKNREKKKQRQLEREQRKKEIQLQQQEEKRVSIQDIMDKPTVVDELAVLATVSDGKVDSVPSKETAFQETPYISSGFWTTIDKVSSFGLSTSHENMRISRQLRTVRKVAAHYTGMHGIISGKGRASTGSGGDAGKERELNEEDLGLIRKRIAAIEAARRRVASANPDSTAAVRAARQAAYANVPAWRRPMARLFRRPANVTIEFNDGALQGVEQQSAREQTPALEQSTSWENTMSLPDLSENQNKIHLIMTEEERERVKEIDRMIQDGQKRIYELQIKKDALQKRPNPLYNYTTPVTDVEAKVTETTDLGENHRTFNFPSEKLVSEYIDELVSVGRLQKMNHTELWKRGTDLDSDDDEEIGDDLLTPSGDAKKLYENRERKNGNNRNKNNGAGGSWLLRQSLGAGSSLGEKIGEAIENAAYKGVCSAIMAILAQSIAALHGVNVMKHSDIRLYVESATDLPPVSKTMFQDKDYAKEAIGKAIRRGSKKKKRKKLKAYQYGSDSGDDSFIQRDAVVETLVSHCQISAPLLKLFPPSWQRALLGNIITIVAAAISDFAEGVQFQILGHQLAFSFKPITEADLIQHIGVGGFRFNHRRAKPEEFEAAVRATADDISQGLGFLDRWHERALGGDLLRAQIGNLIARVVLTLVDEVLHSARMDLWSAQVGGPRVVAGLEYRSAGVPNDQ